MRVGFSSNCAFFLVDTVWFPADCTSWLPCFAPLSLHFEGSCLPSCDVRLPQRSLKESRPFAETHIMRPLTGGIPNSYNCIM